SGSPAYGPPGYGNQAVRRRPPAGSAALPAHRPDRTGDRALAASIASGPDRGAAPATGGPSPRPVAGAPPGRPPQTRPRSPAREFQDARPRGRVATSGR